MKQEMKYQYIMGNIKIIKKTLIPEPSCPIKIAGARKTDMKIFSKKEGL